MTDEAEAAEILVSAYRSLGLDEQLREAVSTCLVEYTPVAKTKQRCCLWGVKDSVLNVTVCDTDMGAATRTTISSFARQSVMSDPRLSVRFSYVPGLVFMFLVLGAPAYCLAQLILGRGLDGALVGLLGMIATPLVWLWSNRTRKMADVVFVDRLVRVTSLDEERVRDLYSEDLKEVSGPRMLVPIELWFLLCVLLALLFAGLF